VLYDLYLSDIQVIKSRKMRWVRHVRGTCGRGEVHTGFWWGNLRNRDHLDDPGISGRIQMDLQEVGWGHGLD